MQNYNRMHMKNTLSCKLRQRHVLRIIKSTCIKYKIHACKINQINSDLGETRSGIN